MFLRTSSLAETSATGAPRNLSKVTPGGLVLAAQRASERHRWRHRAALLIGAVTAVHLLIIATTSLTDTEAYYAVWARHLDWSYYDHAPLLAWVTWAAGHVSTSPFALRLAPVLLSALLFLLVYRLGERLFSPRAGWLAALLASAVPCTFFMGFVLNPEAFFLPLFALSLLRLADLRDHDEPWRPLVLGASVGLAFLAKYTGALLAPLALLQIASAPDLRRWLRRPSLYLGALVALGVASPVVLWNLAHGWPTLRLHLGERMAPPALGELGARLGHVFGGQLFVFHPLLWPVLVGAVVLACALARRDLRHRFLALASAPLLLFLLGAMIAASDSEPHWTAAAYLPAVVALAGWIDARPARLPRALRGYLITAVGAGLAFSGIVFAHAQSPALLRRVPDHLYRADADAVNETVGWPAVRQAVAGQAALLGPRAVVAAAHNVLCGHLAFALDEGPTVYCPSPRRTEFDFLGLRDPPPEAPVVLVDSARYPEDPARALPGRACREVETVEVTRAERPVGRFRLRACSPRPR